MTNKRHYSTIIGDPATLTLGLRSSSHLHAFKSSRYIGRFQKSVEKQVQKNDEMDLRVVHHSCSYLNFIPFLCLLLKKATHAM